jgi:hypothetical protein
MTKQAVEYLVQLKYFERITPKKLAWLQLYNEKSMGGFFLFFEGVKLLLGRDIAKTELFDLEELKREYEQEVGGRAPSVEDYTEPLSEVEQKVFLSYLAS